MAAAYKKWSDAQKPHIPDECVSPGPYTKRIIRLNRLLYWLFKKDNARAFAGSGSKSSEA